MKQPNEFETRVAARESVLRLVEMTGRPLRWAELEGALGFLTKDARVASEWLMDHGYIAPVRLAGRSLEAMWTLGDKGRAWVSRQGPPAAT